MPKTNDSVYSNLVLLRALMEPTYEPKPLTASELEILEQARKFRKLQEIQRGYTGKWNAGARYFYTQLIRAYGLDDEWKESLMELAKPTPGRRHDVEKAVRIALLKRQGLTAKQIAEQLGRDGNAISIAGVESYSKRRRKPSVAETVKARAKRTT
jgi:hypothetical protein